MLIYEPGLGHRVCGEVFEVAGPGLARLDAFEGTHSPAGYRRMSIAVTAGRNPSGQDELAIAAWVYVKDRAGIDAIQSEMLAEYPLDPRYVAATQR